MASTSIADLRVLSEKLARDGVSNIGLVNRGDGAEDEDEEEIDSSNRFLSRNFERFFPLRDLKGSRFVSSKFAN